MIISLSTPTSYAAVRASRQADHEPDSAIGIKDFRGESEGLPGRGQKDVAGGVADVVDLRTCEGADALDRGTQKKLAGEEMSVIVF